MKENETRQDTQALYDLAEELYATIDQDDTNDSIATECWDIRAKLSIVLESQLRGDWKSINDYILDRLTTQETRIVAKHLN